MSYKIMVWLVYLITVKGFTVHVVEMLVRGRPDICLVVSVLYPKAP